MTGRRQPGVWRSGTGGRLCRWLLAWALLTATPLAQAADSGLEFAVKAAYIPKFVPFVAWPDDSGHDRTDAVRICVVGSDPFGDLLDRVASGQSIGGHTIVVQRMRTVSRGSPCQILFAAGSADQSIPDILAAVRGTPVLTMTDDAHDPQNRGIINFIIVDNRVRFEIDDSAAAANGLSVSSKLLSLATRVLGGG